MDTYDEFSFFEENVREFGLTWKSPPVVRRRTFQLGGGRELSALQWGNRGPELVLIHGGAQNAHTWDTVALALERPLLAVDLPGHGQPHTHEELAEAGRPPQRQGAPRRDLDLAVRSHSAPAAGVGQSFRGLEACQ